MRRFPANPFAQPSAPSRGGAPPSRASPPAPLGWRGPPLGACQISFFLAPTWTGEGEGSGLFDAAPRLRFAPCPRPLPFPASGPTGARPLAPFTYGICTRTEQGKKNTGQEQEQKTQNTPFPAVFYNHARQRLASAYRAIGASVQKIWRAFGKLGVGSPALLFSFPHGCR